MAKEEYIQFQGEKLEKFDGSDLRSVFEAVDWQLSSEFKKEKRAKWRLDSCEFLELKAPETIPVFIYNSVEGTWDDLDSGKYIVLTVVEERGGKIRIFFESSQFYYNSEKFIFEVEGRRKASRFYLEIYVLETLAAFCLDPEMRISILY